MSLKETDRLDLHLSFKKKIHKKSLNYLIIIKFLNLITIFVTLLSLEWGAEFSTINESQLTPFFIIFYIIHNKIL